MFAHTLSTSSLVQLMTIFWDFKFSKSKPKHPKNVLLIKHTVVRLIAEDTVVYNTTDNHQCLQDDLDEIALLGSQLRHGVPFDEVSAHSHERETLTPNQSNSMIQKSHSHMSTAETCQAP